MRVLVKVTIPAEAGNAAIQSGALPKTLQDWMAKHKPEASYFLPANGYRTGMFFVNLEKVSDMPVMAEPFFMGLNAQVEFTPVMNAEDLAAGLAQLGG